MWTWSNALEPVQLIQLVGDVGFETEAQLKAELDAAVINDSLLVVDLSEVKFADIPVIRTVVETASACPGRVAIVLPEDPMHVSVRLITELMGDEAFGLPLVTSALEAAHSLKVLASERGRI